MGSTVKLTPLLATAPTVTTTFPVAVEPPGTVTLICVSVQSPSFTAAAGPPPANFTVLEPWLVPKPVPVIVTGYVPTTPDGGVKLVIVGAACACEVEKTATSRSNRDVENTERIRPILRGMFDVLHANVSN